jgi:hypothetical protein
MMTSATSCLSSTSPCAISVPGLPECGLGTRKSSQGDYSPITGARQVDMGRGGFMKVDPFNRLLPTASPQQPFHNACEGVVDIRPILRPPSVMAPCAPTASYKRVFDHPSHTVCDTRHLREDQSRLPVLAHIHRSTSVLRHPKSRASSTSASGPPRLRPIVGS